MIKELFHAASKLMDRCLFALLYTFGRNRRPEHKSQRVLLVSFGHIGDFILWLDSARALKTVYPNHELVLLTWKYADCSVIAQKTGIFNEIIVVDTGWKRRIWSVLSIMKFECDTVICVRPTRNVQTDIFVLAPKTFERIAPASDLTEISTPDRKRSDQAYTRVLPCGGIETMELIRNAQFMRALGAAGFQAAVPYLKPMLAGEPLAGDYFVICPGADHPLKRWPVENFAKAADRMIERMGISCVLVGTRSEKALTEQVIKLSAHRTKMRSIAGKTDLLEYIEVLRHAKWILSSDTSAAHIGAAVGTPTLAIASGWDWGRFFPYRTETGDRITPVCPVPKLDCLGCGKNPAVTGHSACIVNGTMKCVQAVMVEDVLAAWEAMKI